MLCFFFTNASCSVMSDSVVTPWTVAHQAPLSMGILRARILECIAMTSRGSSQPRDQTQVSRIGGGFFTLWATREALRSNSITNSIKTFKWSVLKKKNLNKNMCSVTKVACLKNPSFTISFGQQGYLGPGTHRISIKWTQNATSTQYVLSRTEKKPQ